MMRSRLLGALVALLACSAGRDPLNPGTPLGTYQVDATLTQSSCGGDPPNPWQFDVKLSYDKSTLYWVQGGPPVQGTLDSSGHVTLTDSSSTELHPASQTQGACSVTRTDTLAATFPDGGVTSFAGALSYGYTIDDGSDCLDEIGTTFATLPCSIAYTVTATRTLAPDGGAY
jgi:hypothetical protein